jgi:hypothetical protein
MTGLTKTALGGLTAVPTLSGQTFTIAVYEQRVCRYQHSDL